MGIKGKRNFLFGMFLLIGIVLISFSSATYVRSFPSYNQYDYVGGLGSFAANSLSADSSMCQQGQDFVMTIVPYSCTPAVVRSDLLEEQDYPVYCQIGATQINPLINVKAISSMSISGTYPQGVSSIGYFPSQAALGLTPQTSLTGDIPTVNPILSDLGNVVIVLKQQPNESALQNCEKNALGTETCWIEGNITAKLRYNVQNAFGIGSSTFYLPVLNDADWESNYVQYGFWQGRGYLRADSVDNGNARISIYSDSSVNNNPLGLSGSTSKMKYYTTSLNSGQTSENIYLSGFSPCLGSLSLRLDGVVDPNTRARLKINSDYVEVSEGESFLDNRCTLKKITSSGLDQSVDIRCIDDSQKTIGFQLSMSPRVRLNIDGKAGDYGVGDYLYTTSDEEDSVYVGYIGGKGDSTDVNSLYVYLVTLPVKEGKLTDSEIASVSSFARLVNPKNTGSLAYDTVVNSIKGLGAGTLKVGKYVVKGESYSFIPYKDGSAVSPTYDIQGKKISLGGFSDTEDTQSTYTLKDEYNINPDTHEILNDKGAGMGLYISEDPLGTTTKLYLTSSAGVFSSAVGVFNPTTACTSYSDCTTYSLDVGSSLNTLSGYEGFFDNVAGAQLDYKNNKLTVSRTISGFNDGSDLANYYNNAMSDFNTIVNSYSGEKENSNSAVTYGEQALYNSIKLAEQLGKKKTMQSLCSDLEKNYPGSPYLREVSDLCTQDYLLSSSGVLDQDLYVNNVLESISFQGIKEPTYDEYGARILVQGPSGKTQVYDLQKNKPVYLTGMRDSESTTIYTFDDGTTKKVYYRYNKVWQWSIDSSSWTDVPDVTVASGSNKGSTVSQLNNQIIAGLNGKNYDEGVSYLSGEGATSNSVPAYSNEYIKLVSLNKDSAQIEMYIAGDNIWETVALSNTKTLQLNNPLGYNNYVFTLEKVNLQQLAKVQVIANINNAYSNATFPFKIGVEKRAFTLSPEKAKTVVDSLNNSINEIQGFSNTLGSINKVMSQACVATGAALTLKNFVFNLNGKSIARQKIMQASGGWNDKCQLAVSQKEYSSVEKCLLDNSNTIDSEVNNYYSALQKQNDILKNAEDAATQQGSSGPLSGSTYVDQSKLAVSYTSTVQSQLNGLPDSVKSKLDLAGFNDIFSKGWENNYYTLDQLKDIGLYSQVLLNNPNDDIALSGLQSVLGNVKTTADKTIEAVTWAGTNSVPSSALSWVEVGGKLTKYDYNGLTYANIKGKVTIPYVVDSTPIAMVATNSPVNNGNYYVVLKSNSGKQEMPVATVIGKDSQQKDQTYFSVYDVTGKLVTDKTIQDAFGKVYFYKYEKGDYENKYSNPELTYYEDGINKGRPALVPVDVKNGWYAYAVTYDDSGRVTKLWMGNVGKNGVQEYYSSSGDDSKFLIDLTSSSYADAISGLSTSQASALINLAVNDIYTAQKINENQRTGTVNIGGNKVKIGSPAVSTPSVQCTDFMSPKECNLLFNVCDPVICPSSRCDFGGTYPVKDVVQSGVIGSIALCLPNFKGFGGTDTIPVCLTGVKAGLDGLTSVMGSYRDCLQESIDTGQTVGICDEIYSLYLCDFFWKEALPIAKIGVPKLLSAALGQNSRGGGEYLGVASAWQTAQSSLDYFVQNYASDSYRAFKLRSTQNVGGTVCSTFASVTAPSSVGVLSSLTDPRSPAQFNGNFQEISFTTKTNPPTSQYKVYYRIYAGNDIGANYQVYLKGSSGSYYQDNNFNRVVDSGYVPIGQTVDNTEDFTAPSGYTQLCIVVNGQEECGFKQVSTSFATNYLSDLYANQSATNTKVTTESECTSGDASLYSLLNPNLQGALSNVINPSISSQGLVRVCGTANPGIGTDPNADINGSRWVAVGYCGSTNIKCWLDTQSVKDAITSSAIESQAVGEVTNSYLDQLFNTGDYMTNGQYEANLSKFKDGSLNDNEKISLLTSMLDKVFWSSQKANLYLLRGQVYSGLAVTNYNSLQSLIAQQKAQLAIETGTGAVCEPVTTPSEIESIKDARQRVLKAAEQLNGALAYSGPYSCYSAVQYVYGYADVSNIATYADKVGATYNLADENNKQVTIGVDKNSAGSILFQVGTSYQNIGWEYSKKMSSIQPGDQLDIVWNSGAGHSVIFIKWIDPQTGKDSSTPTGYAQVFDWMGKSLSLGDKPDNKNAGAVCDNTHLHNSHCTEYTYHNVYLTETTHPIYLYRSPNIPGNPISATPTTITPPTDSSGIDWSKFTSTEQDVIKTATQCNDCGNNAHFLDFLSITNSNNVCDQAECDAISKYNSDLSCVYKDTFFGGKCKPISSSESGASLIDAVSSGNLGGVQNAIQQGANTEIVNSKGYTPLIQSSLDGNLEIVKYLIGQGANVGAKTKYGTTALMFASEYGHLDVVKYLLEYGANPNVKDNNGKTALDYAINNGHSDIQDYLVSKDAKTGDSLISSQNETTSLDTSLVDYCGYKVYKYEYDYFTQFLTDNNLKVSDIDCNNIHVDNNHFTQIYIIGSSLSNLANLAKLTGIVDLRLINDKLSSAFLLSTLTNIETLDLSNNKIDSTPDMTSFANLNSINFDDNNLGTLASVTSKLPSSHKVASLSVQRNCISDTNSNFESELSQKATRYYYSGNPRSNC